MADTELDPMLAELAEKTKGVEELAVILATTSGVVKTMLEAQKIELDVSIAELTERVATIRRERAEASQGADKEKAARLKKLEVELTPLLADLGTKSTALKEIQAMPAVSPALKVILDAQAKELSEAIEDLEAKILELHTAAEATGPVKKSYKWPSPLPEPVKDICGTNLSNWNEQVENWKQSYQWELPVEFDWSFLRSSEYKELETKENLLTTLLSTITPCVVAGLAYYANSSEEEVKKVFHEQVDRIVLAYDIEGLIRDGEDPSQDWYKLELENKDLKIIMNLDYPNPQWMFFGTTKVEKVLRFAVSKVRAEWPEKKKELQALWKRIVRKQATFNIQWDTFWNNASFQEDDSNVILACTRAIFQLFDDVVNCIQRLVENPDEIMTKYYGRVLSNITAFSFRYDMTNSVCDTFGQGSEYPEYKGWRIDKAGSPPGSISAKLNPGTKFDIVCNYKPDHICATHQGMMDKLDRHISIGLEIEKAKIEWNALAPILEEAANQLKETGPPLTITMDTDKWDTNEWVAVVKHGAVSNLRESLQYAPDQLKSFILRLPLEYWFDDMYKEKFQLIENIHLTWDLTNSINDMEKLYFVSDQEFWTLSLENNGKQLVFRLNSDAWKRRGNLGIQWKFMRLYRVENHERCDRESVEVFEKIANELLPAWGRKIPIKLHYEDFADHINLYIANMYDLDQFRRKYAGMLDDIQNALIGQNTTQPSINMLATNPDMSDPKVAEALVKLVDQIDVTYDPENTTFNKTTQWAHFRYWYDRATRSLWLKMDLTDLTSPEGIPIHHHLCRTKGPCDAGDMIEHVFLAELVIQASEVTLQSLRAKITQLVGKDVFLFWDWDEFVMNDLFLSRYDRDHILYYLGHFNGGVLADSAKTVPNMICNSISALNPANRQLFAQKVSAIKVCWDIIEDSVSLDQGVLRFGIQIPEEDNPFGPNDDPVASALLKITRMNSNWFNKLEARSMGQQPCLKLKVLRTGKWQSAIEEALGGVVTPYHQADIEELLNVPAQTNTVVQDFLSRQKATMLEAEGTKLASVQADRTTAEEKKKQGDNLKKVLQAKRANCLKSTQGMAVIAVCTDCRKVMGIASEHVCICCKNESSLSGSMVAKSCSNCKTLQGGGAGRDDSKCRVPGGSASCIRCGKGNMNSPGQMRVCSDCNWAASAQYCLYQYCKGL